jgi:hypothetical protein
VDKLGARSVLCVGRHQYLCDHVARVFAGFGVDARVAVGWDEAQAIAGARTFDAILCDYDLLAALSAEEWRAIPFLCAGRVVAVSLNRRGDELPLLAIRGAAAFLYLPLITREAALAALRDD